MSLEKVLPFDPIFDEDGDASPDVKALALRQGDMTVRLSQALNWVKTRELELEGAIGKLKPLIDDLNSEIKFHESRLEYAKSVLRCLFPPGGDSTFANDHISAYYSPSYAVETFQEESIPIEYQEVTTRPNKKAIKDALSRGEEVPGARMVINWNLKIGSGGKKGEHNKKQREKNRKVVDAASDDVPEYPIEI